MRYLKKLAALALAAVMCMALAVPAFAAGDEVTYDIYQIFTGNYGIVDGQENLGNLRWGANGTGEAGTAPDEKTMDDIAAAFGMEDGAAVRYLGWLVDFDSEAYKTVSGSFGQKVTVRDIAPGYYMVCQVSASDGQVVPTNVIQATGTVLEFMPKVSRVPTVDKAVDGSAVNGAAIGDTLDFTITGTVPGNLGAYYAYYYTFTDTMSAGLSLVGDASDRWGVKVMMGEQDVTDEFYIGAVTDPGTGETVLTVGTWLRNVTATRYATTTIIGTGYTDGDGNWVGPEGTSPNGSGATEFPMIGEFTELTGLFDVDPEAVFTVTYQARVNEKAETGSDPNTNSVVLTYSNNPNHSIRPADWTPDDKPEPGDTPVSETVSGETGKTETYVSGLTVTYFKGRTAEDRDEIANRLAGSQFRLEGDGLNTVVDITVGFEASDDGAYYALKNGTYTKSEPSNMTEDQYASTTQKYALVTRTATAEGEPKSVVAVTNDEGQIEFKGLGKGSYTLFQTLTPTGYTTCEDVSFAIDFNETDKFVVGEGSHAGVTENADWFYLDISATSGILLPETGGMGVYALYAGGIALVAIAGAALFLKNKKRGAVE